MILLMDSCEFSLSQPRPDLLASGATSAACVTSQVLVREHPTTNRPMRTLNTSLYLAQSQSHAYWLAGELYCCLIMWPLPDAVLMLWWVGFGAVKITRSDMRCVLPAPERPQGSFLFCSEEGNKLLCMVA